MRANLTTSNTPQLAPENQIPQNEWAVASAAQHLLGRVSPNALAVALALAAHVPFDGSTMKVWPSRQRLLFMCGIGGRSTLSRVLEELVGHGLIEVRRSKDRRKSNRYILNYVAIPAHVIERTLKAVEKASRGPETGQLRSPKTGHESLQCNYFKKEKEKETLEASAKKDKEKERSAFVEKSTRSLGNTLECSVCTGSGFIQLEGGVKRCECMRTKPEQEPDLLRVGVAGEWPVSDDWL